MYKRHVHWADGLTGGQDALPVVPTTHEQNPITLTNTDDSDTCSSPALSTPSSITAYPARPLAEIYSGTDTRSSSYNSLTPKAVPSPGLPRAYGRDSPELYSAPLPSPGRHQAAGLPAASTHTVRTPSATSRENQSVVLNAFLAYSKHPKRKELIWDIRNEPTYSTVYLRNGSTMTSLPRDILLAPATNPPVREMRIHCLPHGMYNPLLVQTGTTSDTRSPSRRNSFGSADYVTIYHVLRAISNYLQKDVTQKEFTAASSSVVSSFRSAILQAYHKRVGYDGARMPTQHGVPSRTASSDSHGPFHSHQDQKQASLSRTHPGAGIGASPVSNGSLNLEGLKRIDYLLEMTRFDGLEQVEGKPGEWFLHVLNTP